MLNTFVTIKISSAAHICNVTWQSMFWYYSKYFRYKPLLPTQ